MLRFWKGIEQKMFFKYSSSGKFSNKIKENNNKNDKNKKKRKSLKLLCYSTESKVITLMSQKHFHFFYVSHNNAVSHLLLIKTLVPIF